MEKAKIIGTGSYLPKKILTNQDLEKMVDTSDEWITTRTGIKERRISQKDEFTSDMGVEAAKKAIKKANLEKEDIDCILVATLTPDYIFPSTACIIQKKLNISKNIPAMDLQAACSGYIYCLNIAKALVESKTYKNVLIVASEKLSSIVNYKDRSTCILFGDGAAACVVSLEKDGYEILSTCLGADGKQEDLLMMPGGGCKNPASLESIKNDMHFVYMNGREVFKNAVRIMEIDSKKCLDSIGLKESDIDIFIPHQANIRIIEAIAKRFNLSKEKVYTEGVKKYGNTSASSVGIALDEIIENKEIKNKKTILLTAFGAGFTWGSAILKKS